MCCGRCDGGWLTTLESSREPLKIKSLGSQGFSSGTGMRPRNCIFKAPSLAVQVGTNLSRYQQLLGIEVPRDAGLILGPFCPLLL